MWPTGSGWVKSPSSTGDDRVLAKVMATGSRCLNRGAESESAKSCVRENGALATVMAAGSRCPNRVATSDLAKPCADAYGMLVTVMAAGCAGRALVWVTANLSLGSGGNGISL